MLFLFTWKHLMFWHTLMAVGHLSTCMILPAFMDVKPSQIKVGTIYLLDNRHIPIKKFYHNVGALF